MMMQRVVFIIGLLIATTIANELFSQHADSYLIQDVYGNQQWGFFLDADLPIRHDIFVTQPIPVHRALSIYLDEKRKITARAYYTDPNRLFSLVTLPKRGFDKIIYAVTNHDRTQPGETVFLGSIDKNAAQTSFVVTNTQTSHYPYPYSCYGINAVFEKSDNGRPVLNLRREVIGMLMNSANSSFVIPIATILQGVKANQVPQNPPTLEELQIAYTNQIPGLKPAVEKPKKSAKVDAKKATQTKETVAKTLDKNPLDASKQPKVESNETDSPMESNPLTWEPVYYSAAIAPTAAVANTSKSSVSETEPIFSEITAIDLDPEDRIYILDGSGKRILQFSSQGKYRTTYPLAMDPASVLEHPIDFACDDHRGIYVIDAGFKGIHQFNLDLQWIKSIRFEAMTDPTKAGTQKNRRTPDSWINPIRIAIDQWMVLYTSNQELLALDRDFHILSQTSLSSSSSSKIDNQYLGGNDIVTQKDRVGFFNAESHAFQTFSIPKGTLMQTVGDLKRENEKVTLMASTGKEWVTFNAQTGQALFYNIDTQQLVRQQSFPRYHHRGYPTQMKFSSRGDLILALNEDPCLVIYDSTALVKTQIAAFGKGDLEKDIHTISSITVSEPSTEPASFPYLWVADTQGNLHRFSTDSATPSAPQTYHLPDNQIAMSIQRFSKDEVILLCAPSFNIYRFNPAAKQPLTYLFNPTKALLGTIHSPSKIILSEKTIWLSDAFNKELYQFSMQGNLLNRLQPKELDSSILDFTITPQGLFWMLSQNAIVRYPKDGKPTVVSKEEPSKEGTAPMDTKTGAQVKNVAYTKPVTPHPTKDSKKKPVAKTDGLDTPSDTPKEESTPANDPSMVHVIPFPESQRDVYSHIAIDSASGMIILSDERYHRLVCLDESGMPIQILGKQGNAASQFYYPTTLLVESILTEEGVDATSKNPASANPSDKPTKTNGTKTDDKNTNDESETKSVLWVVDQGNFRVASISLTSKETSEEGDASKDATDTSKQSHQKEKGAAQDKSKQEPKPSGKNAPKEIKPISTTNRKAVNL